MQELSDLVDVFRRVGKVQNAHCLWAMVVRETL